MHERVESRFATFKKQTEQKYRISQYFPKFTITTLLEHPQSLMGFLMGRSIIP